LGKRRKSRESALKVLYQRDITQQKDAARILTQFQDHFEHEGEKDDFAESLVLGVLAHEKEIDDLIVHYSKNWRLDRMTIIDRNILRIAIFELLHCKEIPPKVTMNEAIDLGKRFGSEESGSFINGILDRIQNESVKKPA
jgi:transcription antitermination protein NusB